MDWTLWRRIVLVCVLWADALAQPDAPPPSVPTLPATRPATAGAPSPPPATPTERIRVHLLTFSPGNLVWERFGHNAILILDVASDTSVAYDFGNFDFDQTDFVWRFARGEMRYWAERKDPARMLEVYISENRQIWAQQLLLPEEQLLQLWKNLEENVAGDARYYKYDYYTDNCSTRIRDHIDRVTDGALRRKLQAIPTEHSYRWHTRIGMESEPLLAAAVDSASSRYVDRPLNAWEAAFLPAELMKYIQLVSVDEAGGRKLGEVARERNIYLNKAEMVTLPPRPPVRWPFYLGAGALLGAALALCGLGDQRRTSGRIIASCAWALWGLLAGLAGIVLVFFWFFTSHRAAYANENLLAVSPLAVALVAIGPLAACGRARIMARALAVLLSGMAAAGVALKLLPGFDQDNWRVLSVAVPAQAGLLIGVWLRTRDLWDARRINEEFRR